VTLMIPFDRNPIGLAGDPLLTLTDASGSANTFRLDKVGTVPDRDVQYSLDNGLTWTTYGWTDLVGDSVTVQPYGSVKWRGVNSEWSVDSDDYIHFQSTGIFDASGNPLSLLDGKGETRTIETSMDSLFAGSMIRRASAVLMPTVIEAASYAMHAFFASCASLIAAPELPATTMKPYCYYSMFYNCPSLTEAPALPAMTLASQCYRSMFNTSGLIHPPVLPATKMASYCYYCLFYNCYSLLDAPELPSMTLASHCYDTMFRNCTSLVSAPMVLPATTVPTAAYDAMFSGCESLATAPEIMGTTIAGGSMNNMFRYCASLSSVKVHFTSWTNSASGSSISQLWLSSVKINGVFTCPSELDTTTRGTSTVPESWTVVNE